MAVTATVATPAHPDSRTPGLACHIFLKIALIIRGCTASRSRSTLTWPIPVQIFKQWHMHKHKHIHSYWHTQSHFVFVGCQGCNLVHNWPFEPNILLPKKEKGVSTPSLTAKIIIVLVRILNKRTPVILRGSAYHEIHKIVNYYVIYYYMLLLYNYVM